MRLKLSAYAYLQARIGSRITVIASGVSVTTIGSLTTLGYLVGISRYYQWADSSVGMAPNTGIGFVLTGLALTILGFSNRIWRCN